MTHHQQESDLLEIQKIYIPQQPPHPIEVKNACKTLEDNENTECILTPHEIVVCFYN